MKTAEGKATFLRCQYCGKNLWPLRGLFDEDFCSRDHRQRYHERVRKALEHLPKTENGQPTGIAGFQFDKPRVQPLAATHRTATEPWRNPASPALPDFPHDGAHPSFAATKARFAPVALAPVKSAARVSSGTVSALAPNVLCIDAVRERHNRKKADMALAADTMKIAPRPGDVKFSQRARVAPAGFDELNHVYVRVPDPLLDAVLPVWGSLAAQLQPLSFTAKALHTASAGPSGAGRVEFFPAGSRPAAAMPVGAESKDGLSGTPSQRGEQIWLEDPMSWQIPVNIAKLRPSMAGLQALDHELALEQFREAQSTSSSKPSPVSWEFHANGLDHSRTALSAGPALAAAVAIATPSPRDGASAPRSNEVATFGSSAFQLLVPEIDVEASDLEMFAALLSDVALRAEVVAPQVQDRGNVPLSDESAIFDASPFSLLLPDISVDAGDPDMLAETPLNMSPQLAFAGIESAPFLRSAGWVSMDAHSVLPATSAEIGACLADAKFESDLVAKSTPTLVRTSASSLAGTLPIHLPFRAVQLAHGPELFATEPVIADSVARPVSARAQSFTAQLTVPELDASTSDVLFEAMATETIVPAGALSGDTSIRFDAEVLDMASLAAPDVNLAPAGFRADDLKKITVWARNPEDHSPWHFGCMQPQLALCLPESHYEEYPLALQVSLPEPRTVTVFETANYDEQQPSNVVSISESRPVKRFTVPGYMKGMAAGVMLASFLWFGSSSIKSDGITMRPGDLIRLSIQRRAVYEVGDNFHAGLTSWEGKGFSKSWAYDKEGFVRPGRLAFYKPSHDMQDYRMEFLTQIEHKSVGWVFRAEDEQNYYAMKLAVTEPGPRPLVALVRYAVVDGKRESHGEQPLQVMMHNNRPYRVSVDVKGNRFLTSIEGQVVDSWSDDRLKSGGVGLFAEGSEKARVYWMKVTKNSDFLGKLCSILVPKES